MDMNLFLKKLNGEQLVDLKHKSPENKEITKMLVHQGLPQQVR